MAILVASWLLLAGQASAVFAASPRIVQGTSTFDDPSVGVLLRGDTAQAAAFACSGVLVGCSTFITAGHCVCLGNRNGSDCQPPNAPEADRHFVHLQHGGTLAVSNIQVHPDFDFPNADVAVLTLAAPLRGVTPAALAETRPVLGQAGRIVGFGSTGGDARDFNLKRTGTIQTAACISGLDSTDLICWDFTGSQSNTCGGDSGGALFIDFGGGDRLAGLTSGGEQSNCLAPDHSYDADLAVLGAWAIEHADDVTLAGPTHCGVGSTVGGPHTVVVMNEATASQFDGDDLTSFVVESDVRELRVALNVKRGEGADFDLLLRQGAPPSGEDFDCAVLGSGLNASCVVDSPEADTWFAAVRPNAGTAEYQLVATMFPREPACGDFDGDGEARSSDALSVLLASVDLEPCELALCDLNGDGSLTASDALRLLQLSVGVTVPLFCPLGG